MIRSSMTHPYLPRPPTNIELVWFKKLVRVKFIYYSFDVNIELHMYFWYVSPFIFTILFVPIFLSTCFISYIDNRTIIIIIFRYCMVKLLNIVFHLVFIFINCSNHMIKVRIVILLLRWKYWSTNLSLICFNIYFW